MANRSIEVFEYRQVIYRLRQGQSGRAINRDMKMGRHKIADIKALAKQCNWLGEKSLPSDEVIHQMISSMMVSNENSQRCKCEPFSALIKDFVDDGIKAITIYRNLVSQSSFDGSYNSVQRFVKKYKNSSPVKMTAPINYEPGEAVQVDFGAGPKLYDERTKKQVKTWYFVMTLCWSRHQYATLITNQDVATWLKCHQDAFEWFGGVTKKVIIDNAKCAVTKASYDNPELNKSYSEFAEAYGFIVSACPPRDPQKKGRVESGIKYIKSAFQPLRHFKSLQDANRQLKSWVLGDAGNRKHGTTFKKPLDVFEDTEKSALKALPETKPEIASWHKVKLYKDCHVRFEKIKYSAPFHLYHEHLWLQATASLIRIYHDNKLVSVHPRGFTEGAFVTKNEHLPPEAKYYFEKNPESCLDESKTIGPHCHLVIENLLNDKTRDLLRQAQRVLRLKNKYSLNRLEKACQRASAFASGNYETIHQILKSGLDYQAVTDNEILQTLNPVYLGYGKHQRQLNHSIH